VRPAVPGGACSSGLLLGIFALTGTAWIASLLIGVLIGVVFGLAFAAIAFAAIAFAATGGQRDFTSASRIVANRYDVLCTPAQAEQARAILARFALRG
jgi:uncharacterized membrane protein